MDQVMAPEHIEELRSAMMALESPSIAIRVADVLGNRIEQLYKKLPGQWQESIVGITQEALEQASRVAIWSIDPATSAPSKDLLHKLAVTASGAVGGAFGLPALTVELPFSTTIMLRSIADIARCAGEDLGNLETKLACIAVFALGGRSKNDDDIESVYYVTRVALGTAVSDAAAHLSKDVAARGAEPVLVKFVNQVAARFSISVSEKAVAQSVHIIGAAGGALINNLFIDHYQNMARGHFAVRRLERTYPPELVQETYEQLRKAAKGNGRPRRS